MDDPRYTTDGISNAGSKVGEVMPGNDRTPTPWHHYAAYWCIALASSFAMGVLQGRVHLWMITACRIMRFTGMSLIVDSDLREFTQVEKIVANGLLLLVGILAGIEAGTEAYPANGDPNVLLSIIWVAVTVGCGVASVHIRGLPKLNLP